MFTPPAAIANVYPDDRFVFVGCCDENVHPESGRLAGKTAALDAKGQLALDLETQPSDGLPYQYTVEGDVEDVSRQHIAGRASFVVHPAPWYVGLKRPPLFVDQKDGLSTAIVAVAPDGKPVAGVKVDLTLVEVQWHSVRRAEGNGFYTWETERKEVDAGHFTVTTAADPVPLAVPLKAGGSFVLRAVARDGQYRSSTRLPFYSIGSGYTAWERYDHNRIDLVPERETYKPGETARLMIQSPWEKATALLTVEREGIRSHTEFALTSTQQTVTVPITAADIPNVFVSVLLVKGRTPANTAARRHERSRQTVVPARLRATERRGCLQAPVRHGQGQQGRIPSRGHGEGRRAGQRRPGRRRRERSDAVGGGLRRAVAHRIPHAGRARFGLRAEGAPGDERGQPPAHRQPPRAHAEGRRCGRWRRRWTPASVNCARTSACSRSGSGR